MTNHISFLTIDGQKLPFKIKHPFTSYAGLGGIYAFTEIDDFSVRPIHFARNDDLACLQTEALGSNSVYTALKRSRLVGVAVCTTQPKGSAAQKSLVASLNENYGLNRVSEKAA